nr:MAG TPA: minor tail protein [Caudoviricetes sp.]
MLDGLTPIVNLATASTENLGTVSDIVSDALTAFGLSASDTTEFCDVLAATMANSNTNVAMLGETFQYAAPLAGALGFSIQDVATAAGLMANAGIKASVSGTALRTLFANMGEKIELTSEAFDTMTVSAINQDGSMRDLNDIIVDLRKGFQQMTEAEKASNAEAISGKTGMSGLLAVMNATDKEFNSLRNSIMSSTGATQKMADIMGNTTQGKVNAFKSKLEALGIQLADNLLPHVNAILDKGMALIDWFSSLDEETQKTIISTGLFATATGGALKIIGGLTSGVGSAVKTLGSFKKELVESTSSTDGATKGVGKLVTRISKLGIGIPQVAVALGVLSAGVIAYNEYQDAMNKNVVTAKEDMSLLERAFLTLSGAEVKSKDELVKLGLVYDDFNSNISTSFQESVKEMTNDVHNFNLVIQDLNLDGVVSEDEIKNVNDRVKSLVDSIEATIKGNTKNVHDALLEMYNSDGVLDESEQHLLEYWNSRNQTEINEAKNLEKAIKDILNGAKDRQLTEEEINNIQNYYQQLKIIELKLQADNSYELEYANAEFQNRLKTLDAESAKELLQQRYKQYEEEKVATESKYDALIAQVKNKNSELTEEDKKLIADLEAQKQQQLANTQKFWDDSYNYAINSNENLAGAINKYNGEILKATDKNYYDRYVLAQENLQGLNEITETGYQTMLDTTTSKYVDMYAVVNEKTGQLQGLYNLNTGAVSAMSSESAKEIEKLYQKWGTSADGIATKNLVLSNSYIDTSNKIIDENGRVIGSLGQVKDNAGNLQDAILDLNGNPIKVGDNAKEVIEKLQNTKKEVNNLDGSKATVKVDDGGSINSFGSRLKNMFSNLFGGGKSYAIGTNNAPQGIHTVNEKGWELIDAPSGKMAVGLGENAIGETAYLPKGTKVRTNLSSTELMMKEIKKEVSNQISKIDFSHQYYKPPQVQTRMQRTDKVSNNADNELLNSMNTMITLLAQLVNKDTDIYIDSRKVGKTLATVVDEQIAKRARGKF